MAFWEKFGVHTGSWGLPELGATEWLGSQFAKAAGGVAPLTGQLGSSLFGPTSSIVYAQEPYSREVTPTGEAWAQTRTQPQVQGVGTTTQPTTQTMLQPTPTTTEGGGTTQPSGPSPEEIARQRNRQIIEEQYGRVFGELDKLAGLFPEWRKEKETQLEQLYGAQRGELATAKEATLSKFPEYEQQVARMQGKSIRELEQNLRNMLQAGNVYLGTRGAAGSSAAPMYAYALSKQSARSRADILNQANQMYNELNQKRIDVENTFNQQLGQLNTWKASELGKITDWYQQNQAQLQQAKVNATQEQAQAIAQAEQGLLDQALARLQGIEDQATQWDTAMKEWAINRMAQLDDMRAKYGQLGTWSPQEITYRELQGMGSSKKRRRRKI